MNRRWPLLFTVAGCILSAGSSPGQTDGSTVRFQFREPLARAYHVPIQRGLTLQSVQRQDWLRARPESGSTSANGWLAAFGHRQLPVVSAENDGTWVQFLSRNAGTPTMPAR